MIPLSLLARYALPLIVAAVYLGDVDLAQQALIFDRTMESTDEVLSQALKEGEGNETFDYIIVGAGAAGAVLANRLTASGQFTVLLLEAGGDPNPITDVPLATSEATGQGLMDWGYSVVRQNKTCGNRDGLCWFPRGKALGGCTQVNGLAYNRGKPQDFDRWANFTGDPSWSWESILATYNSIENYQGTYAGGQDGLHGSTGEMYVSPNGYAPGAELFEQAAREKGYPIGDMNGGRQNSGFSRVDLNIKEGLRWGTYQAFLEPILNRTNLSIYRYALATKIETEKDPQGVVKAVGVTYERHGATFTALAGKEVLVSGGVVESPKLLMLSGLGPKEHLEELGIPTVLDLPAVGQNYDEHVGCQIQSDEGGFKVNTTFGMDTNTTESLLQYLNNGTGPFGARIVSGNNAIASGHTYSRLNDGTGWPDVHHFVFSRYFPERDEQRFHFSAILHRTSSKGSVKLASRDAKDKPLVDPNLLADDVDVERFIDGIENMLEIFLNTEAFKGVGIQPFGRYEACDQHEYLSREFWKCYIQLNAIPDFHPTSSCRMGPDSSVSVLDSKLKVFGTTNLRVIDASSFPFAPTGNIALPAMLVGARGAEIILSGE